MNNAISKFVTDALKSDSEDTVVIRQIWHHPTDAEDFYLSTNSTETAVGPQLLMGKPSEKAFYREKSQITRSSIETELQQKKAPPISAPPLPSPLEQLRYNTEVNNAFARYHASAVRRAKAERESFSQFNSVNSAVADPAEMNASASHVSVVCASDIKAEPTNWIWEGWLARGKLHILAGAGGTGKTTLAIAIVAAITTGGYLPDGASPAIGAVLIWSGEDNREDTLKPRLMANGADSTRVFFVDGVEERGENRPFDPAADMSKLVAKAQQISDLRLIILDSIVSAVAGDSHKNTVVRRSLEPLVTLGNKLGCAILGIMHFSKGTKGRAPLERVTGSLAFGALARVVMGTAKPAEEGAMGRLVRAKSNIGPDGGGFEYELEQVCVVDGPPAVFGQRVVWGDALEGTARDLLDETETPNSCVEVVQPPNLMLLEDIHAAFTQKGAERLFSAELVATLVEMDDRPWRDLKRGKPLSQNTLARLLKSIGVAPCKIRIGESTQNGYRLEQFKAAFSRAATRRPIA